MRKDIIYLLFFKNLSVFSTYYLINILKYYILYALYYILFIYLAREGSFLLNKSNLLIR